MDFLYTTTPIMVTLQILRADKVSKMYQKVVKEDFDNTIKNHIDCICRFLSGIFLRIGLGLYHPQMPLTIKKPQNADL